MRFTCRFRTQNLKANPDYELSGADLVVGWIDEKGMAVDSASIAPHSWDQNWKTERRVVEIPAQAKSARLYLVLDHASGAADFDNIHVEVMEENKK